MEVWARGVGASALLLLPPVGRARAALPRHMALLPPHPSQDRYTHNRVWRRCRVAASTPTSLRAQEKRRTPRTCAPRQHWRAQWGAAPSGRGAAPSVVGRPRPSPPDGFGSPAPPTPLAHRRPTSHSTSQASTTSHSSGRTSMCSRSCYSSARRCPSSSFPAASSCCFSISSPRCAQRHFAYMPHLHRRCRRQHAPLSSAADAMITMKSGDDDERRS